MAAGVAAYSGSGSGDDAGSGSGKWRRTGDEGIGEGCGGAPEAAAAAEGMRDACAAAVWTRYDVSALEKVQECSVVLVGSQWRLMLSTGIIR